MRFSLMPPNYPVLGEQLLDPHLVAGVLSSEMDDFCGAVKDLCRAQNWSKLLEVAKQNALAEFPLPSCVLKRKEIHTPGASMTIADMVATPVQNKNKGCLNDAHIHQSAMR